MLARPVLAVLPFENKAAPEDAYFADGIAEELISELSSWRWFPILSRDSSFDRTQAALPAFARAAALGARYAVTGRLLRAGDSSRLTVELLDTAANTQLWSASYAGDTAALSRTQSEIASEIFGRIAPELASEETRRVMRKRHEDLTAWDMTIKGLCICTAPRSTTSQRRSRCLRTRRAWIRGSRCRGASSRMPVSSRRSRAGKAARDWERATPFAECSRPPARPWSSTPHPGWATR